MLCNGVTSSQPIIPNKDIETKREIEKCVLNRFFHSFPMTALPSNLEESISKISTFILEKIGFDIFIKNPQTRPFKSFTNVKGATFIITREMIISMRFWYELFTNNDLVVPLKVEPFKNFLFNELSSYCNYDFFNYFTVLKLKITKSIFSIHDSNTLLIQEIALKLRNTFLNMELSFSFQKKETDQQEENFLENAKKELLEARKLIPSLEEKKTTLKYDQEIKDVKKMMFFLEQALNDFDHQMPMLFLSSGCLDGITKEEDYFECNNFFRVLYDCILSEKKILSSAAEKVDFYFNEVGKILKNNPIKSNKNLTYKKLFSEKFEILKEYYLSIEKNLLIDKTLFKLHPENYEENIRDLQNRILTLNSFPQQFTDYSESVQSILSTWDSECLLSGEKNSVKKDKKFSESKINLFDIYDRDIRDGIIKITSIITASSDLTEDYYDILLKTIKDMKQIIPIELLVNAPLYKEKQLDLLLIYLMSLWKELNQEIFDQTGRGLDDGLYNVIAYLSMIYRSHGSSMIQFQKDATLLVRTQGPQFLRNTWKHLEESLSLSINESLNNKIKNLKFYSAVIFSCITRFSKNPDENPLSLLLHPIPSQSFKSGTIPPFIHLICDQVMAQVERVFLLYYDEKKCLEQEEKMEWMDKLRQLKKHLSRCFGKEMDNLIQLRTMQLKLGRLVDFLKDKSNQTSLEPPSFIYLEYLNNTLTGWLNQADLLGSDSRSKSMLKSIIEMSSLITIEEIEVDLPKRDDEIIEPIEKIEDFSEKEEILRKKFVNSRQFLEYHLTLLLSNKTLNDQQSSNLCNVLHHLGMIEELEKSEWPLDFSASFSHQYLLHISLSLELIMKSALPEDELNTWIEDSFGIKQQIRTTHRLGTLYDLLKHKFKLNSNHLKDLKELSEIMVIDRNGDYKSRGRIGRLLQEIKEFSLLKQAIDEKSLTTYQENFCQTYLDPESKSWKSIVEMKIREKERAIRNLGENYLIHARSMVRDILPKTEEKSELKLLLCPDVEAVYTNSKVQDTSRKKMIDLFSKFEKKLSSEDLQNKFEETFFNKCHEYLVTLRQLITADTSNFKTIAGEMYYDHLGKLTEWVLLNILKQSNSRFLRETYTTETQTRQYRRSHQLITFVQILENNYPDFKLSEKMWSELKQLKNLYAHSLHYPINKDPQSDQNQNIVILQDQIRMQSELCKKHMSEEASKWFIKRYGPDNETWEKKLNHDIDKIWNEKIIGLGTHVLEMLNLLLEQQ